MGEADATADGGKRTRKARRVILFSDGTGNSSGKLFKTNVWRLYEAIDLGPIADGGPEQVALYSNGVGTSTFRPLALLGGVFGIGLKANVLELYKYLCRNWRPGDDIYLFGFSRGAFTIRLLIGLIASQGILRGGSDMLPPDEDKLAYQARAAYRAFAGSAWPNRRIARFLSRGVRAVRDAFLGAHRYLAGRDPYDRADNCFSDLAFVGVWDTVAAYGGPIVEITRGIDDWIWPLTMPNYQLSPRVAKARHALALDDERDAFQPLLWDEVREDMLVRWGGLVAAKHGDQVVDEFRRVPDGRLKQVWFSGMHADVGGGYPDESLSFVSLLWMIDELDGALRLLPEHVCRIASMSNVYGPMHDSRSGLGGYYRFQPRRIRALVDWLATKPSAQSGDEGGSDQPPGWFRATRSLRDPEIADRKFVLAPHGSEAPREIVALAEHIRRDHGLLTSVRVHESAIARVVSGTDNYAPISLPRRFDTVFAKHTGQSKPVLDPRIARQLSEQCRDEALADEWERQDTLIGDTIWRRRILYFTLMLASVLLATLPLWEGAWDRKIAFNLCVDGRCVARPLLELADTVSGGYLHPWVDSFARHVLLASGLFLGIVGLFAYGSTYDLRLRSRARRAWRSLLAPADTLLPEAHKPRGIARIRSSGAYQQAMTALRWLIAPAVAGFGIIVAGLILVAALVSQLVAFPFVESRARACPESAGVASLITAGSPAEFPFTTAQRCVRSGRTVKKQQDSYAVRVTLVPGQGQARTRWSDGVVPASPAVGRGADLPWMIDLLGGPFRRVTLVGWLQPLTIVRRDGPVTWWSRLVGRRVDIDAIALTCDPISGGYVGRFKPRIGGLLDMSVNDAMIPGWPDRLYRDNKGAAVVQVWTGRDVPPAVGRDLRPAHCGGDALEQLTSTSAAPAD